MHDAARYLGVIPPVRLWLRAIGTAVPEAEDVASLVVYEVSAAVAISGKRISSEIRVGVLMPHTGAGTVRGAKMHDATDFRTLRVRGDILHSVGDLHLLPRK